MANTIADKYQLEVMPMAIGGKRLEFHGIANWDTFVERLAQEGDEYVKTFPFWVKIWEASIVLTDHMIQMGLEKEREILEIGAGMGITGLFLAAFGHKVTITDYEEDALELIRMNVEHNRLANVSVKKLDWNDPSLTGTYDIICGSELIYNEAFIGPIIDLLKRYLRPRGTVCLAQDIQRKSLGQFVSMVPGRFEMENVVKTMKANEEVHKVVIHLLRLKSDLDSPE